MPDDIQSILNSCGGVDSRNTIQTAADKPRKLVWLRFNEGPGIIPKLVPLSPELARAFAREILAHAHTVDGK